MTNTGSVTTRQVTALINKYLLPDKQFDFFENEEEFMRIAAQTPRSNCVMENQKLLDAGITISHVNEAIEKSLRSWR